MGRKNRRDGRQPQTSKFRYVPPDFDSDVPDQDPVYTEAVSTILKALEGLWYESPYTHESYEQKTAHESEVNDLIAAYKAQIQGML